MVLDGTEAWVLDLPSIGPMVRDYRAGLGMPRRAKVTAAVMIVIFVSISAWIVDGWLVRAAILIAGLVGLAVILFRIPTKSGEHGGEKRDDE